MNVGDSKADTIIPLAPGAHSLMAKGRQVGTNNTNISYVL